MKSRRTEQLSSPTLSSETISFSNMDTLSNGNHHDKLSYFQKEKALVTRCNLPDLTANLSDEILSLILSLLPMKDAARTCILSRRWRNLWKHQSSISFDVNEILGKYPHISRCASSVFFEEEPSTSQQFDEFVTLVDQYFENKSGCDIEALSIHIRSRGHYHHLDRWLNLANGMNIDKLKLNFRGYDSHYPYELDVGEYILSLKHFSLNNCGLKTLPGFIGFHSLISLAFEDVVVSNNFINYCPLLERLTLINCRGLYELNISNLLNNLKYVKVIHSASTLEMHAKNINHFECSGFVEAYLYPDVDESDEFDTFKDMGFPRAKYGLRNCIFTPDPKFGGFKSLKQLALFDVTFTPILLRHLLSNCFSVEELTFGDCSFLLSYTSILEINGLVYLQSAKVLNCSGINKVIVKATNVKQFVLFSEGNTHKISRLNFQLLDDDGNDFSTAAGKPSLLKHLHLRGSKFALNITNFTALETVLLEDIYLTDEDVGNLLTSSLFLKRLDLITCHGFFTLNIMGPFSQLKVLNVRHCKQLVEIGICASNLMEFRYLGQLICFSLREVPKLVTVEIQIEEGVCDISSNHVLSMLSKDVPHLQTLFFHVEDEHVPEALPTFLDLKHLALIFSNKSHTLSWATLFLLASPFLEKFQVQLPGHLNYSAKTKVPKEWVHHHLKEVELFQFGVYKKEIKFATNLLHNAKSLELMKIDPRVSNSSRVPFDWVQSGREKTIRLLRKETRPGIKLEVE